ncbi:aminopeptidase N [Novosphingobium rosa]|uniref:aminopeptidase N n=1 Tax=Novosphingobium rosa TaxID=76978 RepID=UPI0008354451
MDAQTSPSAPAAPQAPTVIRREDYQPPVWLVSEVDLDFHLGLEATRVTSLLRVQRNPDGSGEGTIRLNGDGLTPLVVKVDDVVRNDWRLEGEDLLIDLPDDSHEISIVTQIHPAANSQLMGLYASGGMLCTQCEAEGFRRITYFPDRPDVLSVYRVRMEGDKALFPVLLANGNCLASGDCPDSNGKAGAHWAEWHDPWPKPSYLFALVAGDLVASSDSFTTVSGREVALNIWTRAGDETRTAHAMRSLINSMRWDEEAFGREYDLDLFNIVAVSDFNMGAMENKGLNIFNTRYVLAEQDTATDGDFDAVEGVIGHEYFHNWSGNRITCRDWFQLSLKEGFTVLRDQLFSADMGSEPVKRIEDVRVLRGSQFPEDSGPLAHPIRPDSYQEISNFYTATVYNKGAEVIRMMRTMAGTERFRQGTDLYFERHDGEAATCEDFVKSIEDGAGLDLTQFRLWYAQAGTPTVTATLSHEGDNATLHLTQSVPATPGQPDKAPMPIPLRIALFDRASGQHHGEQLVVLEKEGASFHFAGHAMRPVLSINRGFSAPVVVESDESEEDLVFLAAHDDDPFARYEAMQSLILRHLVAATSGALSDEARGAGRTGIATALRAILEDGSLDDLMLGELLMLPTHSYLSERLPVSDPGVLNAEREGLKAWLGVQLGDLLRAHHDRVSAVPFGHDAASKGARKVKTQALVYLAASEPEAAAIRAAAQYDAADNMTDRQGALAVLCSLESPLREEKLAHFHARYQGNPLVIDKWFSLQAGSLHPKVLDHVKALAGQADFTMSNPNRVRALFMSLAVNPAGFHDASGEGYRMIGDLILALDPINAQTAARFVPPLGRWRRVEPGRGALMREQLERIVAQPGLSKDVFEQASKSLG